MFSLYLISPLNVKQTQRKTRYACDAARMLFAHTTFYYTCNTCLRSTAIVTTFHCPLPTYA